MSASSHRQLIKFTSGSPLYERAFRNQKRISSFFFLLLLSLNYHKICRNNLHRATGYCHAADAFLAPALYHRSPHLTTRGGETSFAKLTPSDFTKRDSKSYSTASHARINTGQESNATSGEEPIPIELNGSFINGNSPVLKSFANGKTSDKGISASIQRKEPEELLQVRFVAETDLPTDIGYFRLRAYRIHDTVPESNLSEFIGREPCIIYSQKYPPGFLRGDGSTEDNVPVRVHDQCVTSEVFGSQRCDCSEQLKLSLEYVEKNGGIIIYLQQEGRGIGLANKVAAYALQDEGMDTVDANIHLGFPADCRQYGVVPTLLNDVGISSIHLMTNNPRKIDRLQKLGINIPQTIPMVVPRANKYNKKYLETKQHRMNHKNFGGILNINSGNFVSEGIDFSVEKVINEVTKEENGSSSSLGKPGWDDSSSTLISIEEQVHFKQDGKFSNGSHSPQVDNDTQTGVSAAEDGYCFGRKSVEDAIGAITKGELVVVVDDESRENEGDFIMAADFASPSSLATMIRYTSGVICVGMEGDKIDKLQLPAMVAKNEDPKGTAFTISVDATKEHGITTGISARDRATTIRLLSSQESVASDFTRPGHIFPLRAKANGVLSRDGHTEASVDLARLAGCNPAGILCEIVSEENPGEMARLPELKRFCKKHGYVMTSIVDIAQYRRDIEK